MAKADPIEKKNKPETELNDAGDLMYLFPVHSPAAKEILKLGQRYNDAVSKRTKALAKEIELKTEIRAKVKQLGYPPLPDGSIRLSMDGTEISVTPQDEKVKVKVKDE
jgi:hypothetical protein